MIRKGILADKKELQALFVGSILEVCKSDYNSEQLSAWSSGVENINRWLHILTYQQVLVAQKKDCITGFCTLDGNHIDLFFVHKDHQRTGVATKLYEEIEKAARQRGERALTSDVSQTARPFFEKMGFKLIKEQHVIIKGVELTNFKMMKTIEEIK